MVVCRCWSWFLSPFPWTVMSSEIPIVPFNGPYVSSILNWKISWDIFSPNGILRYRDKVQNKGTIAWNNVFDDLETLNGYQVVPIGLIAIQRLRGNVIWYLFVLIYLVYRSKNDLEVQIFQFSISQIKSSFLIILSHKFVLMQPYCHTKIIWVNSLK